MSSDDDEFGATSVAIAALLLFGVFILAGKGFGRLKRRPGGQAALAWGLILSLASVLLGIAVGAADATTGACVAVMGIGIAWAVAAGVTAQAKKRLAAAREDDLLPNFIDDDQWWDD